MKSYTLIISAVCREHINSDKTAYPFSQSIDFKSKLDNFINIFKVPKLLIKLILYVVVVYIHIYLLYN